MPEESAAERTEDATPRKRSQAQERGNVARSRDLSAALVLFVAVLFLRYGGAWFLGSLQSFVGTSLSNIGNESLPPNGLDMMTLVPGWVLSFAGIIAPMLILLFFVAIAGGVSQVGFIFSAEPLALKIERLNPVEGFKRLFNLRSFVTLAMSLGKVALVTTVAWFSFAEEFEKLTGMVGLASGAMGVNIVQAVLSLMLRLSAVLLVLALLDAWYQRYQWERDLRMTKQEIKEEMRDTDGDPKVKSRRRQIQRRMAQQRMMSEVPKAEVVVRNPTHFAVALSYNPEKDRVPYLVAKGTDFLALRIIKIAVENKVPVKYQPKLARELCKLEIGDEVPQELWSAVIEVLAWVYRSNGKKKLAKMMAG